MADSPAEGPDDGNALVQATALVVLGAGLLALFLGYSWFWMVFALGFAVLVPMVKLASDALGDADGTGETRRDPVSTRPERESAGTPASKREALDSLRDRYARGELGDEAFERKVERLLETETLEDARDHVARERGSAEREREPAERPERGERERE